MLDSFHSFSVSLLGLCGSTQLHLKKKSVLKINTYFYHHNHNICVMYSWIYLFRMSQNVSASMKQDPNASLEHINKILTSRVTVVSEALEEATPGQFHR